ncbi:MAG: lysylphosphatidylglycerol synthase transmembrane domain-containing protein [Candidatus Micrarchaeota archaeon]
MSKRILIVINAVVSLLLVALILHLVGFENVISELSKINLWFLFLSIASLFAMDLVMSYRIQILLREAGESIKFFNILKSHFVGILLADFSPSRTGYFATAAALKYNYNVPSDKALLSIFGPQIFDFVFKVVTGSIAILYILFVFIGPTDGWILILGAVVISLLIALMVLILFSKRFLLLFSFVESIPIISKLYKVVVRMQDSSHVIVKKTPHIIALILISWNFRALSWYFAAKTVGINLETDFPEFLAYYFLQPLITMLEFIPSPTIAGLGLSEGGATLVFALFGVLPAKAALFALIARFKSTLLHLIAVPEALKVPKGMSGDLGLDS